MKNGKLVSLEKGKIPVWIMRQAGRYLPEYRDLRTKAGSFWNLCRTPVLAAEVSLQPIRRFGFDAAIVFSDILEVPAALGVPVDFFGDGPKLKPISSIDGLVDDPINYRRHFVPVYETVGLVRKALPDAVSVIGFAGAPWTLAAYMAAGGGGDDQKAAKLWAYRQPESFAQLIDILVDCVSEHLIGQLLAGADTVQLFDSWAGGMAEPLFLRFVMAPAKRIVAKVKAVVPQAGIIGFPRGITLEGYGNYAKATGVDVISLDTAVPIEWAEKNLDIGIQGNLDPLALVAGGAALEQGVMSIMKAMRNKKHIFNLGHGILRETPVEHVEKLVSLIRSFA
jgi:uroporphyrinogen decarboxylase